MFWLSVERSSFPAGRDGYKGNRRNRDGESEPRRSGCQAHWYALFLWILAWLCYTLVPFEPRAVLCPMETGCGGTGPGAHQHHLGQVLEGFRRIRPIAAFVSDVVGLPKDSKPRATCVKRGHWWRNVFASAVRLNGRLARICLGLRLMKANADASIHVRDALS